jgi:YD repeat-containing protein
VNSSRRLTAITDPDAAHTDFAYTTQGWLDTLTDRRGGKWQFYYNTPTGLVDSVQAPSVTVDEAGMLVTRTPRTRYTRWQAVGVPTTTTSSSTPFTGVTDTVRTAVVRDPLGLPTFYEVDLWGQPTRVADTLGEVQTSGRVERLYVPTMNYYTYTGDTAWSWRIPTPLIRWTEDPVQGRGEYRYSYEDPLLSDDFSPPFLQMEQKPGASPVYYAYVGGMAPQIDSIWGPGIQTTRYHYGVHSNAYLYGLPDSVSMASTATGLPYPWNTLFAITRSERYTYNTTHWGRTSRRDPEGHLTTYSYDPVFGNLAQVTQPSGATTATVFDSQGRDSVVSGTGRAAVVTTYDALDRVLTQRVLTTPNVLTTYAYDALYPTAVVDGASQTYTTERDALGRVRKDYAANSTTSYRALVYDAAGRLVQVTNRRGQVLRLTYDARGRLLTRRDTTDTTVADTMAYPTARTMVYVNAVARDTVALDEALVGRAAATTTRRFGTDATKYFRIVQSRMNLWTGADSLTVEENTPDSYFQTRYRQPEWALYGTSVDLDGQAVLTPPAESRAASAVAVGERHGPQTGAVCEWRAAGGGAVHRGGGGHGVPAGPRVRLDGAGEHGTAGVCRAAPALRLRFVGAAGECRLPDPGGGRRLPCVADGLRGCRF